MRGNLMAAIVAMLASGQAAAQSYTFHTIDYKKKFSTVLEGINKSQEIVGNYIDNTGHYNCFTVVGKTKTLLKFETKKTGCFGINNAGDIVGFYTAGQKLGAAFLYSGGTFTDIKPPHSAGGAIAYGISDAGKIAGTYIDENGAQHGFVLAGKKYTSFDVPGAVATLGVGINDSGQLSIQSEDSSGNEQSYVFSSGNYVHLLFPNAASTRAHALNNKGEVALGWIDSSGNENGGVYDIGSQTFYSIDRPGESQTGIEGINDRATLVGIFASPTDTVYEGFKATGKLAN